MAGKGDNNVDNVSNDDDDDDQDSKILIINLNKHLHLVDMHHLMMTDVLILINIIGVFVVFWHWLRDELMVGICIKCK